MPIVSFNLKLETYLQLEHSLAVCSVESVAEAGVKGVFVTKCKSATYGRIKVKTV